MLGVPPAFYKDYSSLSSLASTLGSFYPNDIVVDPDLNNYLATRVITYTTTGNVSSSTMHTPSGSNGTCFVFGAGGGYVMQIVNDQVGGLYIRSCTDRRNWSSWIQIAGVS